MSHLEAPETVERPDARPTASELEFRLLGPVEAVADGREIRLDGAKQRSVLAALLLSDGRVLPDERLRALLWGWDPPATWTAQLHTYASRLRGRLGPRVDLVRRAPGYRLDIGEARVDLHEFRRSAELGRRALEAGAYARAAALLCAALAHWRGAPLTGVTPQLAGKELPALEESRLAALENRVEADLALGGHRAAVAELRGLVAEHPARERLRGQLMAALYRCDRQSDALEVYEQGRRLLAEELGVDPGPTLRGLHWQVLTSTLPGPAAARRQTAVLAVPPASAPAPAPASAPSDPAPTPARADQAPARARVPSRARDEPSPEYSAGAWSGLVPAMLPPAVADFAGRERHLAALRSALGGAAPERPDCPPEPAGPVVLTGGAGCGKSALAVQATHLARPAYPDGVLYADLRGPDGGPRDPAEALRAFLRALGADERGLPGGPDELVRLYRSRLAGRRVLVVLDNAQDERSVRPLLTSDACGRTVVTSRSALPTVEGAQRFRIGPLDFPEAYQLLAAAGRERVSADPAATARIVELCDRLPLALRICAGRLAARPHWTAARLADRLAPAEHRLDELRLGELDVRASLAADLPRVRPAARTALRVLARAGADSVTPAEAAALLRCSEREAEEVLELLTEVRLLTADPDPAELRYRMSSLVRLVAREQSAAALVA
ncbi:BTAD domain-containing putative transcriptional regulator [Kitasatospora purpeofusca]|uniref:AfsR/SARP family transcriptional regulator n=1 Tax=Kitasatospora purpeofusca TaxID=67352 RepID=UPI0035DA68CA